MVKTSVKEFKLVNVELLVPYANNARTHSKEQIKKLQSSLREFGFVNPLIIDREYNVLAGHGRLAAAKAEGYKEVPCVFVEDLTKAQKKAYMLADNRMALDAGWDEELLAVELEGLSDLGFDLSLTGFDGKELSDIFGEEELEAVEDNYEVELPEEPKTKLGDIYQLGRHRLMCGDSTDKGTVEKLMGGNKTDISFTSPPYNAGNNKLGGNKNMLSSKYINDTDNKLDYIYLLEKFTKLMIDYSQYCFVNIQMLAKNKIDVIDYLSLYKNNFVDVIIWDKSPTAPAMAENVMNSSFEFIFIFNKNENPSRAINTFQFRGNVSNVYTKAGQRNNKYSEIHAATFPMHLPEYIIKTFTREEASVIDCFGGTGTTLIACEQLNRTCYMMELDPKYCDVIIDRWEQFTGQKAAILKRYVENTGDAENVYCIRNGQKVAYADVVKQVDGSSDNSSTKGLI